MRNANTGRLRIVSLGSVMLLLFFFSNLYGQSSVTIILENGMEFGPGTFTKVASVDENPTSQAQKKSDAMNIGRIDDGLREIYFNGTKVSQVPAVQNSPRTIVLGNSKRVAPSNSLVVQGINRAVGVTPFDSFGRRVYSLATPLGQIDVLQGITEVSPKVVRVEGLSVVRKEGDKDEARSYVWDMRLSLTSIQPQVLRTVLLQNAKDEQGWLDVVDLYSQANRYGEAREILIETIRRYPELEERMRPEVKVIEQRMADQLFEEVQTRERARQFKLAASALQVDVSGFSIETKIKAQDKITELTKTLADQELLLKSLRDLVNSLDDESMKKSFLPVVDEIDQFVNQGNIERLVDFRRLGGDESQPVDQRIALGIGGWILGASSNQTNLATIRAAIEARPLITEYFRAKTAAERSKILTQIQASEAGNPTVAARIIANMLPPIELDNPVATNPGRYQISTPISPEFGSEQVEYLIQIPPEYDPYQRYPCVLALHGELLGPEIEMEWWVGEYSENYKMHLGEATRHGYIVITPKWMKPKQLGYDATENEHARILACLRDAMRRTSIDSDRIFLAGHHAGANAAWDLAVSHPDLWAGFISLSGNQSPFITHYRSNARLVPSYFVLGHLDGVPAPLARDGAMFDNYLGSRLYDCCLIVFKGRGRDHFQEELKNIIQWMNLTSHRRKFFVDEIEVSTARAGDSFFWWLEVDEFLETKTQNPLLPLEPERVAKINGKFNNSKLVSFQTLPAKSFTIWLSPEYFDFAERLTINRRGSDSFEVQPDLETLLEDARRRVDRQHPFWAKVSIP